MQKLRIVPCRDSQLSQNSPCLGAFRCAFFIREVVVSIRAMQWAWEQDLPTGAKLTLLAIADHAGEDGTCWPGQARLSEKTGFTDRAIRKHLTTMRDMGIISIRHRSGDGEGRKTNIYKLHLWTLSDGQPEKYSGRGNRNSATGNRNPSSAGNRNPSSYKPSGEPSEEPSEGAARKRCPDSWHPSDELVSQMRSECPAVDLARELKQMRDWEFKSARRDWNAVYRRWMREEQKRLEQRGKAFAKPVTTEAERKQQLKDRLDARAVLLNIKRLPNETDQQFYSRVQRV